ncbi:ubiquinol oxidase subunit II [Sphingomonas sp. R86520]|uniref:ubiquinol oxidase subunit II n=1 Tax=Sphingomonas sp. R86520 TaxID=3093859 RepID=UPI0036D2A43E
MVVMSPTGDIALQQRNLILTATGLMLLVIVPVMVLTVLFAWRYRSSNPNKVYDPHFDHSTTLELVIWCCPLLIIICLGAVTWTSTHRLDPFQPLERIAPGRPIAPDTRPLEIQVVALDWKWLFIYPEQNIASVNELALPKDVPVHFSITSTDQFSTFYAPTLAGMIYAMPGMQSALNAVINKTGDSWGYSGNYTGAGHTDMRFRLHAVEPGEFDRWVAQVRNSGPALSAVDYIRLAQPSMKVPVLHFGSVAPQLFDRVLNRCVEPGKPCMVDVMRHDQTNGRPAIGPRGPGIDAAPLAGGKPVPALQKAPEDKGSGPNVTKPAQPGAPGQLKPGDQRNRDLSRAFPFSQPGAPRAAHA